MDWWGKSFKSLFCNKTFSKKVLFDQYEYRLPTCFIPNGSQVNK